METSQKEKYFCIGDKVTIIKNGKNGVVADTYTTAEGHTCVVETDEIYRSSCKRIQYRCTDNELKYRT